MQSKFAISDEQSIRLNILKFLMAIFVVYIHNNTLKVSFSTETVVTVIPQWFALMKYTVSELISKCAVPCFFLMSSIFLYRRDFKWKDNTIKKIKSLLVPYFIMITFYIVVFAVCQSIPQTAVFFGNDYIIAEFSVVTWFQAYGIGARPLAGVLWSVRNLFILNLLAPVIKFIIDRFPKISIVVIVASYFLLPTTNIDYLQIAELSMWCFGYLIVKCQVNINKFDGNRWIPIIYIGTMVICLILRDIEISVISTVISRLGIAIGIIFWYSCFTNNLNGTIQKLFQKYSKYNYGIYIFHYFPIIFATKLVTKVFGTHIYVLVLDYIFLPPIIIVFSIIVCIVLKKLAPKTFSLLTGARI